MSSWAPAAAHTARGAIRRMRIHFICDHKWRDLPNITAIKVIMQQLGHKVTVASGKETVPLIRMFRPDCVVFNHMQGAHYSALSRNLKNLNIAVAVLPTEGAADPFARPVIWGEYNDYSSVDLFLSWSRLVTDKIEQLKVMPAGRVVTIGCTRFDFYRKPLAALLMTREEFCALYGLEPNRPLVVWATKYGYAALHGDRSARWDDYLRAMVDVGVDKCYAKLNIDYHEIPAIHHRGRDAATNGVLGFAAARPDVQVAIKPHPMEDRNFYKARIAEAGLANVILCNNQYIWDVLNASDVLLAEHCTTAVEAWLLEKPTIELKFSDKPLFEWSEHEAGSARAETVEQLVDVVDGYLENPQIDTDIAAHRRAYVETYYHAVDGKRIHAAAAALDDMLNARAGANHRTSFKLDGRSSWKATVRAAIGYGLSLTATQSLTDLAMGRGSRGRTAPGPDDKLITRRDVAAYERRLRPLLMNDV